MTNAVTETPKLSVITVLLGGADHLVRWLDAIAAQEDAPPFEVIIAHDTRFGDPPVATLPIPNARYLRFDSDKTFAELRTAGIRASTGKYIVFTEDHCLPRPDWVRQIVRLHDETPHAAVGGPMDKTGPDSILNWSVYLQDFSRYMTPVQAGPTGYLTDCNVSYKRDKLMELEDLWAEEFHETPVNWTLLEKGETLWLAPEMAVGQLRNITLGYALNERFRFGQLFAGTRVGKVGRGKGFMYAALVWVLPPLITFRVGRDVFSKGRAVGHFLVGLPVIFTTASCWALGELVGYVTGHPPADLRPVEDSDSA